MSELVSRLFLEITAAGRASYDWPLEEGRELRIGRDASNDLHFTDTALSRHHARLQVQPGGVRFEDAGSRNGSLVNGRPVLEPVMLQPGDRVRLGTTHFVLRRESPVQLDSSRPGSQVRVEMPIDGLRDRRRPSEREKRLFEDVTSANRALELTRAASAILVTHRAMPEFLDQILELALEAFHGERAAVALVPDADSPPEIAAARGLGGPVALEVSRTVSRRVLLERTAVCVVDVRRDPDLSSADSVKMQRVRSLMCAPLLDEGRVFGLLYVDRGDGTLDFDESDLKVLAVLANVVAGKCENARAFQHGLDRELRTEEQAVFSRVHRSLLPDQDPQRPGLSVHGICRPCATHSGDLFDHFPVEGGALGLLVAGTSAEGLPAVALGSGLRTALRAGFTRPGALSDRTAWLDGFVREHGPAGIAVSVAHVELASAGASAAYVVAGQPPPLVVRADGRTEMLVDGGPPTWPGVGGGHDVGRVELASGDRLVLYSRGLIDARGGEDTAFGTEGIGRAVREAVDAEDGCDRVLAALAECLGSRPLRRDATVLCVVRS